MNKKHGKEHKMRIPKDVKKIDFFNELYEKAKSKHSKNAELFKSHYAQYRGDSSIDGSQDPATCIRNITYEIIESQINSEIPQPQVNAGSWSEKNDRNAKKLERLLSSLRDRLPFEMLNDLDERYTYILGGSVWYIEWDETIRTHNEIGGAKVHCISPEDFIPQPSVYWVQDMEYCFLRFHTTKDEIRRKYGLDDEQLDELGNIPEGEESDSDDTADLIVCFYKDEDDNVCNYIFAGDIEISDVDNYYARKRSVCKNCRKREELCSCDTPDVEQMDDEYEELTHDITCDDGTVIKHMSPVIDDHGNPVVEKRELVAARTESGQMIMENVNGIPSPKMIEKVTYKMEATRIPWYKPKLFPIVIRKNTSQDKSLFGQSDCEYLRPQQQQINKLETRVMQKLLRSGITPVMPEDATVALNNAVFGNIIKLKPGESASQYGVIDTQPNVQQDLAQAERIYDMAKRVIGVSDSYQGFSDTTAKSGYAKQVQVQQSAGRLESKRRMKHSAYAEMDAIIAQLYMAYADEPRPVAYKDAFGRMHRVKFNRYDYLEYDELTGEYYYNDDYLFSVDLNGGVEQQRQAMWELNLNNLSNSSFGPTDSMETLLRYWQAQERAHYPHARENVEYFSAMLEQQAAATPAPNGSLAREEMIEGGM